jgi:hypothetical protein
MINLKILPFLLLMNQIFIGCNQKKPDNSKLIIEKTLNSAQGEEKVSSSKVTNKKNGQEIIKERGKSRKNENRIIQLCEGFVNNPDDNFYNLLHQEIKTQNFFMNTKISEDLYSCLYKFDFFIQNSDFGKIEILIEIFNKTNNDDKAKIGGILSSILDIDPVGFNDQLSDKINDPKCLLSLLSKQKLTPEEVPVFYQERLLNLKNALKNLKSSNFSRIEACIQVLENDKMNYNQVNPYE